MGLLGATCAPVWAAPSSTPAPGPVPVGRVTANVTACHAAGELSARYATFAAQMTTVPSTAEMSLRLQLYEHTPATTGYHLVSGVPGFGVWENSAPGVSVFNYSQEVTSLVAPASFRVQVGYRWLDAGRHVIKRASRTTTSCVEPPPLPNLVAGAVSFAPGSAAGMSTYDVNVRNDGAAKAGPFAVGLSVNGVALADETVPNLAPGTRTVVEFSGSTCPRGASLEVTVDPGHAVVQSTEVDDMRTVACR